MKKKIKKLFLYRKLPLLLSHLGTKKAKALNEKLIDLQKAIYKLDLYLEANWKLEKKELSKHWKKIFKVLKEIGFNAEESYDLTSHIRRYQKHETRLREGLIPTQINEEYYYYYKSCDVRLMREIIYSMKPKNTFELELSDWRYFDLITEINDDVEDVFEDQESINGNMFLIQILEDGLENTKSFFTEFIDRVLAKQMKAYNEPTRAQSQLCEWTIKEAELTKDLLQQNCKKINSDFKSLKSPLIDRKVLQKTFSLK